MFWDPKIFKISKNNVYMIFYVKKLYHVKYTVHFIYIYIYITQFLVYIGRERERYTHIKKISKYVERHIYIYIII